MADLLLLILFFPEGLVAFMPFTSCSSNLLSGFVWLVFVLLHYAQIQSLPFLPSSSVHKIQL